MTTNQQLEIESIMTYDTPEVLTLLELAKTGSQSAYDELWQKYHLLVERTCYRIIKYDNVEDAVQETFTKAFINLPTFRKHCKFSSWLIRIAINCCLADIRKKAHDLVVCFSEFSKDDGEEVEFDIAQYDPGVTGLLDRIQITRAVTKLNTIDRTVFTMRDIEGYSIEETAKDLSLTVPAVKSRLLRARLILRQHLTR